MPHVTTPPFVGAARTGITRFENSGTGIGPICTAYVWTFVPAQADPMALIDSYLVSAPGNIPIAALGLGVAAEANPRLGTVYRFDCPRSLSITADFDDMVFQIHGIDQYGQIMNESIVTLSGVEVQTKRAFSAVIRVSTDGSGPTVSIGTGKRFGFPFAVRAQGYIASAFIGSADDRSFGAFALADENLPYDQASGDVRGTYEPSVEPDGTMRIVCLIGLGERQYGPTATRQDALGYDNYSG